MRPLLLIPSAMASPAEAVVRRQLEACNAQDLEGFLAACAADIQLFADLPRLRCEIASRIVEGPFVIDHEICDPGLPGEPPMRAAASGSPLNRRQSDRRRSRRRAIPTRSRAPARTARASADCAARRILKMHARATSPDARARAGRAHRPDSPARNHR